VRLRSRDWWERLLVKPAQTAWLSGAEMHSGSKRAALASALFLASYGQLFVFFGPMYLGAVTESFALSPSQLARLGSVTPFTLAVSAIVVAAFMTRVPFAKIGTFALALSCFGDLASLVVSNFSILVPLRYLESCGLLTLFSLGVASIAKSGEPERGIGWYLTTSTVAQAISLYAAPLLGRFDRAHGFYVVALVLAPVAAHSLRIIGREPFEYRQSAATDSSHEPIPAASLTKRALGLAGAAAFISFTVTISTFSERFGRTVGLTENTIGQILAVATVLSLGGSLTATWLGGRRGRMGPVVIGTAMWGLVCVLFAHGMATVTYVTAMVTFQVAWLFTQPFLTGLIAALDSSARLLVLCNAVGGMVGGLTVSGAGWLVERYGLRSVSVLGIATLLVFVVMVACANSGLLGTPRRQAR